MLLHDKDIRSIDPASTLRGRCSRYFRIRRRRSIRHAWFATSSSKPLIVHGAERQGGTAAARVKETLNLVGLPSRTFESYPRQLSGGQRQRVAMRVRSCCDRNRRVRRADLRARRIDSGADSEFAAELRPELGLAYVFISHNLAVVEYLATEVAVMYLGRIVEQGPAHELFATGASLYPGASGIAADGRSSSGRSRSWARRRLSRSGQHTARLSFPPALPACIDEMRANVAG